MRHRRIYPQYGERTSEHVRGFPLAGALRFVRSVRELSGVHRIALIGPLATNRGCTCSRLAELYHERWEIEAAFDEFKTHLKGGQRVLRSKTPELVRQEAWGLLLAHVAIRGLMHEAALGALPAARDPDTMSFTHAVRVTRRTLLHFAASPPPATSANAPDHPG